jgi:hypothetical protein
MVPEINLTPQLEERFKARFAPLYGEHAVVSLHSGMTNPQRLKAWLAAHSGAARIVLGTRMAVFASLPKLRLMRRPGPCRSCRPFIVPSPIRRCSRCSVTRRVLSAICCVDNDTSEGTSVITNSLVRAIFR